MRFFIAMFMMVILLIVAIAFSEESKVDFGPEINAVHKIRILSIENHELYGGLGGSGEAIGCASDLWIAGNSSLSFACGKTDAFTDTIYIQIRNGDYFACADKAGDECLECPECKLKKDQLQSLDQQSPHAAAVLKYKLSILRRDTTPASYDAESKPVGCDARLFINDLTPLHVPCDGVAGFGSDIYVVDYAHAYHLCPTDKYDEKSCFVCFSCMQMEPFLQSLDKKQ